MARRKARTSSGRSLSTAPRNWSVSMMSPGVSRLVYRTRPPACTTRETYGSSLPGIDHPGAQLVGDKIGIGVDKRDLGPRQPPGLQHALDEGFAKTAQSNPDHLAAQLRDARDRGLRDHRITAARLVDRVDHPKVGVVTASDDEATNPGQRHAVVLPGDKIGDPGHLIFRIGQLDGHALLGVIPSSRAKVMGKYPGQRLYAKRNAGRSGAGASGAEQAPMRRAAKDQPSAPHPAMRPMACAIRLEARASTVTTVSESISFVSKFPSL